ncbi:MAG: UDP-3-O-(3-hydroxymyristoyl)glucosamine N-acyltransferase, partial [Acidobacteria bacterium]|nr:UDP-3-O-(3-hydroxymyristoyl)glucosamine N-acyltransferase [Acidobacteriota bacterium]
MTQPQSAAALAAAVGATLVGDGSLLLEGVRALQAAGPRELSFAADAKAEKAALESRAGALLARSAARFPGRTVLEIADPVLALISILRIFHPQRVARPGVHPTAVVAGAAIHEGAEIGPFVVVGEGSTVGEGCILEAHAVVGRNCRLAENVFLHPHVVLYDDVVLAARVEIHSGTVLGADGFGYHATKTGILKIPQVGNVEIDADVEIGANTCVDRAALESTRVGAGTKIDDLVMIGHNNVIGRHGFLCGQVGLAGSSTVGDGVVLAGQVGVAGHVHIGNGVKAGGQTGISADVPDGVAVNGSPHQTYRESMKSIVELRRLPETARLVRALAERAGLTE